MAELSPKFGLVQKGQEKVLQQEGNGAQALAWKSHIAPLPPLLSLAATGVLSPHSVDSV